MFDKFIESSNNLLSYNKSGFDLMRLIGNLSFEKNPFLNSIDNFKDMLILNNKNVLIATSKIVQEFDNDSVVRIFGSFKEQGEIETIKLDENNEFLAIIYTNKNVFDIIIYSLITGNLSFKLESIHGAFQNIFFIDKNKWIVNLLSDKINYLLYFFENMESIIQNTILLKKQKAEKFIFFQNSLYFIEKNDLQNFDYASKRIQTVLSLNGNIYSKIFSMTNIKYLQNSQDFLILIYNNQMDIFDRNLKKISTKTLQDIKNIYDIKIDYKSNFLYLIYKNGYVLKNILIEKFNLESSTSFKYQFDQNIEKIQINNEKVSYILNNKIHFTNIDNINKTTNFLNIMSNLLIKKAYINNNDM